MLTFVGVTFSLQWADFDPLLESELALSVEHYPDTDTDEVQTGGVSGGRMVLPSIIASAANLATLRAAMRNSTVGTLTGSPEGNLANMILVAIGSPRLALDGRILADLEFLETT